MAKCKRTNNVLQKTMRKTKDQATRIPQKPEKNSGPPEESAVPAPLVVPVVLLCYSG